MRHVTLSRRRADDRLPLAGGQPIMSETVFGVAKEAVYGTFLAPTKFIPGMPTITANRNIIRPEQARGYRGFAFDQVVGLEVGVTITGELLPDNSYALLCAGAFGSGGDSSASSGLGVYTHTLTPQPQLPSFSYEQDMDIIPGEQVLARQVSGCFVDSFQIKATNQQLAVATVSLIGQRETTPTTPGNPSNTNPTYFSAAAPFSFVNMSVQYKGVSNTQLLDTTFSLMNHTQRVYAANGQLYASRLVPTRREVQLTTLLDFLDTNFYTDWLNGTKTTGFIFTLTSPTNIPGGGSTPYSVVFTIPGTRPSGDYGMPVASDVIQQNVTFSCTLSGANEISSVWTSDFGGQLV